jgi:hypothetical protein
VPQIRSPRIVARYDESTGRWVPISQRVEVRWKDGSEPQIDAER